MSRPTKQAIQWWVGQLAGPGIFVVLTITHLARGDWWQAVTTAVTLLVLGWYVIMSLSWWRMGYQRAMLDSVEALSRSQGPGEFVRLTLGTKPPRPWQ